MFIIGKLNDTLLTISIGYEVLEEYKLRGLPFPYNALEPYIDEQTLRLHHDKHQQG